jgi:glycosyltransferase involved in cell wall biosynthesis
MPPAIHQFSAGFAEGDAIANEARLLRDLFRRWGHASEIFTEARRVLPELRRDVRDIADAPGAIGPDDVALLHLSIGSAVNDAFAALPARKAILYHNITPPEFFRAVQPQIAGQLARGREQAARLAGAARVTMACSRYNAAELETMGYRDVRVLPLLVDFARVDARPDRATMRRLDDGRVNVLFVGRCAPNKRIEDLLAAFHWFQRFVEPGSRLIHVGGWGGLERYHALLLTMQRRLGLADVERPGSLRQDVLAACYRSAHVFLCMSEHEGVCLPVLEAMHAGVPVLAYAAAAVPETMDGAGVLFREKRFDLLAEMMGRLVRDEPFRAAILDGQRRRMERYAAQDLESALRAHLAPLLG